MGNHKKLIVPLYGEYLIKIKAVELLRFFSIGVINTVFCYSIFAGLVKFGFETVFAMTIATLFTIVISFI